MNKSQDDDHEIEMSGGSVESSRESSEGGYGWVVVVCLFFQNAATWGINTAFGVFLSFYRKEDFFPGASDGEYAIVGGLSVSLALASAPLANWLTSRYGFKMAMSVGLVLYVASQILAGFSKKIWELILTQGFLFGIGSGLIYCSSVALTPRWFTKHRALAVGITASGSGAGALLLSITTRIAIDRISLKWAFFINALISTVILVPVILLLRDRNTSDSPTALHPLKLSLFLHPGFLSLVSWASLNVLGYILALYTLATYSTAGLGLSQTQAANLQAILATGQMVGRPLCGFLLDRFGRINMTSSLSFLSGLTCLLIWLFGKSYAVLIVFAFLQGLVGGTIWAAIAPLAAEVVGLSEIGSALSILWVTIAVPALLSEPIGVWLIDYSQRHLHRRGTDAYLISIAFAGGCFCASALMLLGAKRYLQGNWRLFVKT